MGLAIPADVGVIGFGDLESSQLLSPPLTSLRMPVKQIAFETVRLLVEQIRGNTTASPGLTTFRAELIVRASTI
jgi:LacI family repressor for deo operon, udp, cdd, tsx, nupC, and nupG